MQQREFIEVGAGLNAANFSTGPARYRSAVCRAYYGAYHEALLFAASLGRGPSGDRHGGLPSVFFSLADERSDERFRTLGRLLDSLYNNRRRADYYFDAKTSLRFNTDAHSARQVSDARAVIALITELSKP